MTRPVSNLNYSNTFGHVLSTVNLLADTITRFAVTTNGTGWGDSAVAFGNAYVNGSIHVTQLFASNVSTSSLAASGNVSVLGSLSISGPLLSFSNGSTQFTANSTAIVVDTTSISSAGKFTSNSTLFDLLTSGRVNGTLAVNGNTSLGSNTLFVNGTSVSVNGSQNVNGAFTAQSIVSNTTLAAGNTTVGSLTASGALTVSNTAVLGNTSVGSLTASGAVSVTNTASFGNTTVTRLTASAAAQLNSTLTVVGSTTLAATMVNGALSVANAASFGNTTINGFANVNAGSATSALSVRTTASNTYLSLFNSANVANRFGLESNTIVVGTAANTALRLTPAPTTNNETFNYAGTPESNTIVARINGRSVIDGDLIVTGSVRALTLTSNTGDLANLFIRNDIDGNAAGVVTFLAGTRHRAPIRFDTATDGLAQSPIRWQSESNSRAIEIVANPTNSDVGTLRVLFNNANNVILGQSNTTFTQPVYAPSFLGLFIGESTTSQRWTTARSVALGGVLSGAALLDGSANVTITTSFNGAVPVVSGGTSFSSYVAGDILYASGTTSLAKLAIAPANNVLITTGSNFPSWGKLPLASHVSGTLPIGNLPVATSGTSSSTQVVRADDSRLSDARTPTTHTHTASQISDSTAAGRTLLTAADAAAQRTALAVESTTQLNTRDTNNRSRANHTGTQDSSTINMTSTGFLGRRGFSGAPGQALILTPLQVKQELQLDNIQVSSNPLEPSLVYAQGSVGGVGGNPPLDPDTGSAEFIVDENGIRAKGVSAYFDGSGFLEHYFAIQNSEAQMYFYDYGSDLYTGLRWNLGSPRPIWGNGSPGGIGTEVELARMTDVERDPVTVLNSNTVIITSYVGQVLTKTGTTAITHTIPNNSGGFGNSHPVGSKLYICNLGASGNITIAGAAGVTLRLTGTTTTGNRTLAPYGKANLFHIQENVWLIDGPGVT